MIRVKTWKLWKPWKSWKPALMRKRKLATRKLASTPEPLLKEILDNLIQNHEFVMNSKHNSEMMKCERCAPSMHNQLKLLYLLDATLTYDYKLEYIGKKVAS